MRDHRLRLRVGRTVLASLILVPRSAFALAEDSPGLFGPGNQVLNVGAAAFHAERSDSGWGYQDGDGYIYYTSGGFIPFMIAPVSLPAGAEVFSLCLYAYDANPNSSLTVTLDAVKLVPGGLLPGTVHIKSVSTTFDIGYGVSCADLTPPHVVRDVADVDGDAVPEIVAYRLRGGPGVDLALGGVRIFWRRQVSPPPGAPTFGDVPADDGAFQFIEALVAAGVTAGCGSGNYCPDAPLTRRQMAVFLSKALGLHWPS